MKMRYLQCVHLYEVTSSLPKYSKTIYQSDDEGCTGDMIVTARGTGST